MASVIIPTTADVIGCVVLVAIGLAFIVYAWVKGKREEERTVSWIRDWE